MIEQIPSCFFTIFFLFCTIPQVKQVSWQQTQQSALFFRFLFFLLLPKSSRAVIPYREWYFRWYFVYFLFPEAYVIEIGCWSGVRFWCCALHSDLVCIYILPVLTPFLYPVVVFIGHTVLTFQNGRLDSDKSCHTRRLFRSSYFGRQIEDKDSLKTDNFSKVLFDENVRNRDLSTKSRRATKQKRQQQRHPGIFIVHTRWGRLGFTELVWIEYILYKYVHYECRRERR